MTLQSLLDDLAVFCIFLMIGFLLREFIKPLRKLFLPASIIGGAVALILGNQCIGLVQIPDSFEGVSGVLITVVTTSVVFGIDINLERLKSDIDYTLACNVMYGYHERWNTCTKKLSTSVFSLWFTRVITEFGLKGEGLQGCGGLHHRQEEGYADSSKRRLVYGKSGNYRHEFQCPVTDER